jgi:hypothetical protein
MNRYCEEHGKTCVITKKFYLCWTLIGFPILVGPILAAARFLRAFGDMAELFNSTHVFPLSANELAADIPAPVPEPPRQRKSIIEQILDPDEDLFEDDEAETDEDGNLTVRGFYGDYELEYDGQKIEFGIHKAK